jgi:S1-C subfamily serine protease
VQIHTKGIAVGPQCAALGAILGLLIAATALGSDAERKAVIAKVNPSVVQVSQEHELGSGFVVHVDGESAIAATNYHVIEGAKKIVIFFPATDRDMKHGLESDGYLEYQMERDLALVHFNLKGKKVTPLKICDTVPEQGDSIMTFGSPVGQRNTIAFGNVSSVRGGQEVADLMEHLAPMFGKNVYEKQMSYTKDATWIQHTAPMSHGNSGGPLVNEIGEVVGLNTMNFAQEGTAIGGQNLNYSISAIHLKALLTKSLKNAVRPWNTLPAPREHRPDPGNPHAGDPVATMKIWVLLNKARNSLDDHVAAAQRDIDKNPEPNPNLPQRYQIKWNKKVSGLYRQISKAYAEHVAALRAMKSENADEKLILMLVEQTNIFEKLSTIYGTVADDVMQGARGAEAAMSKIKQHLADLSSAHDVLRVNLSRKYHETFPTLEDTRNETGSAPDDSKKGEGSAANNVAKKPDPAKLSALRTWTDNTGTHKIRARYRGTEDGKAKLERDDGAVVRVPLEKLSEADRQFIGADE